MNVQNESYKISLVSHQPKEAENTLYLSKYAPKSLDEIVGNENLVRLFKYYLRVKDFPNMILLGPTGTGKTTMIQLFIKQFLGPHYHTHHLEIYGSLHRGRCIISQASENSKNCEKGIPNILNFLKKSLKARDVKKIITIFDFEYTIGETQMSLRRIMEEHDNVRFILACNSRDNISETIQSRTNIYSLQRVPNSGLKSLINKIVDKEKLKLAPDIIDCLAQHSDGNIRVAINTLQLVSETSELDLKRFYQIVNLPASFKVEELFAACLAGGEDNAIKILDDLINNGYSLVDLLNLMLKTVINSEKFNTETKNRIIETVSSFFLVNETSLTLTNMYCLIYRLLCP